MATEQPAGERKTASQIKQKLQERLENARQRLQQTKQDIDELREEDKENIRKKCDEVRQRMEAEKDRAQELRAQATEWLKERKQQTDEQILSWRQRRELKHLDHRADRAEDYAVNAVIIAMMDADEAEMAVLDAIDARLDADTAAASAAIAT